MTPTLDRRSLLMALGALSVAGCSNAPLGIKPDDPLIAGLDIEGVKDIAASYIAATNDPMTRLKLRRLFVDGSINVAALKSSVSEDFQNRRIFTHKGWYLSHTEGKLFTLLSRV